MNKDELSRENINKLVVLFYTEVLKNDELSGFFIEKLGADLKNEKWQTHMILLTDFWSTIIKGTPEYKGFPFPPHTQIQGLKRESFEMWIKLFFESVDKVFSENTASKFKERSSIIASNFMRNLGI